jgi:DnaJ-class molecular chaperone
MADIPNWEPPKSPLVRTCPKCDGTGEEPVRYFGVIIKVKACPLCHGHGKIQDP